MSYQRGYKTSGNTRARIPGSKVDQMRTMKRVIDEGSNQVEDAARISQVVGQSEIAGVSTTIIDDVFSAKLVENIRLKENDEDEIHDAALLISGQGYDIVKPTLIKVDTRLYQLDTELDRAGYVYKHNYDAVTDDGQIMSLALAQLMKLRGGDSLKIYTEYDSENASNYRHEIATEGVSIAELEGELEPGESEYHHLSGAYSNRLVHSSKQCVDSKIGRLDVHILEVPVPIDTAGHALSKLKEKFSYIRLTTKEKLYSLLKNREPSPFKVIKEPTGIEKKALLRLPEILEQDIEFGSLHSMIEPVLATILNIAVDRNGEFYNSNIIQTKYVGHEYGNVMTNNPIRTYCRELNVSAIPSLFPRVALACCMENFRWELTIDMSEGMTARQFLNCLVIYLGWPKEFFSDDSNLRLGLVVYAGLNESREYLRPTGAMKDYDALASLLQHRYHVSRPTLSRFIGDVDSNVSRKTGPVRIPFGYLSLCNQDDLR